MKKILLVEDNEMNRDMLSRRLERHGFEVVLACDGLEVISSTTPLSAAVESSASPVPWP
jgi:CheY-like chemotaxis protein